VTKAKIEQIVRVWQSRLKLDHWRITVDWQRPSPPGSYAEVILEGDTYDVATVRLDLRGYPKWDQRMANETIVHELVHLHERDLRFAITSAEDMVAKPAWALYWDRVTHEREGLVDRVATVLVELGGLV